MKILTGRILPLLFTTTLLATAGAQEFFREFGTSRTSAGSGRSLPSSGGIGRLSPAVDVFTGNDPSGLPGITPVDQLAEEENYNMRIGNLDFVLAAGLGVEFNDNINLSNRNRESDIIFRPELDIEGLWRISENNKIRFGVGIGYAQYLNHDEFSSESVLISPTSAITWSVKSGAFTFTVRERASYQEDPFDEPQLSNFATFRRWENQAGFEVDWEASEYTHIAAGYDRYDLWAKDEIFKSQDRGVNTVFVRPSYKLTPSVAVGLSASMSWVDYRENLQADGEVLLVGPYVQWRVNDVFSVYAEVGYQQATFDGDSRIEFIDPKTGKGTGTFLEDSDDSNTVYAKLELIHTPSETFRHKLSASKTTELGLGSNFYDLYHIEYTIDWKVSDNTSVRPSLFYEYYETSGDLSEHAHRFGAAVGLYHMLSEHCTIGLDYRFLWKDSNIEDFDYYQNLGLLSIYYKF
jgi:long-subunit fatty acid transport protein